MRCSEEVGKKRDFEILDWGIALQQTPRATGVGSSGLWQGRAGQNRRWGMPKQAAS